MLEARERARAREESAGKSPHLSFMLIRSYDFIKIADVKFGIHGGRGAAGSHRISSRRNGIRFPIVAPQTGGALSSTYPPRVGSPISAEHS